MNDDSFKPLVCPICGSVIQYIEASKEYVCQLAHSYSSTELYGVLKLKLHQTLQQVERQLKERQTLIALLAQHNLMHAEKEADMLPIVQKLLARLVPLQGGAEEDLP
jgi:hypothetical protein